MEYLKIAFRSILRHKGKMIAICFLVFFGTILIILGQSFVDAASYYSKKAIIDNFTGDLIIYSQKSKDKPSPFSFISPLQNISNIEKIEEFLSNDPIVKEFVPFTQNFATIEVSEEDKLRANQQEEEQELFLVFNAIDPVRYQKVFQNINLLEGSFFGLNQENQEKYTEGILIEKDISDRFKKRYNKELKVGDLITVVAFTQNGSVNAIKIPVVGIFEYKAFKRILSGTCFIDMKTYSNLYNFVGFEIVNPSEQLSKALSSSSEEDIFASEDVDFTKELKIENLSQTKLSGYTMIAVKLKEGVQLNDALQHFKKYADQYSYKVVPYNEASGGLDQISNAMRIFILITTTLIFIIVGIIIMNTLIINVNERYYEIGTMRAIGASKNFIRNMFISESLMVNFTGFIAGVIFSLPFVLYFQKFGLNIPKMIAEVLLGGGKLYFIFSFSSIIMGFILILIISIIATYYPIRLATRIPPVKAMSEKI